MKDLNLTIHENEFVAIVGFSGTGKSTLMSMLAGLTLPDEGEILYKGEVVTGPSHELGLVFQNYSLLPWLSVKGNVRMAVDQVYGDCPKEERESIVEKYVDMVNLTPALDKRPKELSGGMRQRTSLARTLSAAPDVLLLDEPLSALDALTRSVLQEQILEIWSKSGNTIVLITNSVDEGIYMADRIVTLELSTPSTFGPEFRVNLERPRVRRDLNHDVTYQHIRNGVIKYLTEQKEQAEPEIVQEAVSPSIIPLTLPEESMSSEYREEHFVDIVNAAKVYPTRNGPFVVLEKFNLTIPIHSFTCLIGHSGCGKSTILTMVAGLNEISEGNICLDGKEISGPGTDRAVVFQSPSLLPWLSAFENVKLGVRQVMPQACNAEQNDVVARALVDVGLKDAMQKKPKELSQGMQQRVGIARAFALRPKLMLLDEPLGMLDALTKNELQELIAKLHGDYQLTTLMVTHDVDEALYLSDRVVMMTNGPLAKVGGILESQLPRPRIRAEVLEHPDYYTYREELIGFLEDQDEQNKKAS